MNAEDVITLLDLEPLAGEGGYFRQTWVYHDSDYPQSPLGTAIYYLVTPNSWSALHRLAYDEVFHFYLGDPCRMVVSTPGRPVRQLVLGPLIDKGQLVQQTVPAGSWQGTKLAPGGAWALLGTTMAPGFTPDIFELAVPSSLTELSEAAQEVLRDFLP